LRRVIFTSVDILLVVLPSVKYMIFAFLHLFSLIAHTLIQPYSNTLNNKIEIITLLSLTSLSLMMTAFPDLHLINEHTPINVSIIICVLLPVIGFLMYGIRHASLTLHSLIIRLRNQSNNDRDINDDNDNVNNNDNINDGNDKVSVLRHISRPTPSHHHDDHHIDDQEAFVNNEIDERMGHGKKDYIMVPAE
jgi:hypothetical protein